MQRVVILGGGFGGLYTALGLQRRLGHRADVDVTLVNGENFFLFYPLLTEAGLGDVEADHVIVPLRNLIPSGARLPAWRCIPPSSSSRCSFKRRTRAGWGGC